MRCQIKPKCFHRVLSPHDMDQHKQEWISHLCTGHTLVCRKGTIHIHINKTGLWTLCVFGVGMFLSPRKDSFYVFTSARRWNTENIKVNPALKTKPITITALPVNRSDIKARGLSFQATSQHTPSIISLWECWMFNKWTSDRWMTHLV